MQHAQHNTLSDQDSYRNHRVNPTVNLGDVTIHYGYSLLSKHHQANVTQLDNTDLYISQYMDRYRLYLAADYSSFDFSLPQSFFDEYIATNNGKCPIGVWCYDNNSIFGEFVDDREMIHRLVEKALCQLRENYAKVK